MIVKRFASRHATVATIVAAAIVGMAFLGTSTAAAAGTSAAAPQTDAVLLGPFPFACQMIDEGTQAWVYCWQGSPRARRHVELDVNGQVSLTSTQPIPQGIGGPGLPYGAWLTVGRFRCEVLHKGFECVVIATGKGFRITRTKIVEVQSAPGVSEPAPVFRKSTTLQAVAGYVLIKEPGTNFSRPLNSGARVPLGTVVDTSHGTVQLTSAATSNGEPQAGRFHAGEFRITQPVSRSRSARLPEGLTVLSLTGAPPTCGARGGGE